MYIVITVLGPNSTRAEIGRIADDRVGFRPFGEERVGADDVFIEVIGDNRRRACDLVSA